MAFPSIGIIGGGIAAVSLAIKLAELGYPVTIYESNDELLAGTSKAHSCRASSGPHYRDLETAKKNLLATIKVLKAHPDFVLGKDKKGGEFLQQCLYLVARKPRSQISKEEMEQLLTGLREFYASLPAEDQVLGLPEKVFPTKPCSPKLYEKYLRDDHSGESIVEAGYLIQERFLDWFTKGRPDLINEILKHSDKIKVKTKTEVVDAKHSDNRPGFNLRIREKSNGVAHDKPEYHDIVVNASWYNIEKFDNDVGFFVPPDSRTNRTKVMIEVELPQELWEMPHIVFCHGPFCAFTNLGNRKGLITYEPVTNVETSSSLRLPKLSQDLLAGKVADEEKFEFARNVVLGIANEFIPAMAKAKYSDIRFGIVKTEGSVNICSPDSDHHKRLKWGEEEKQIGWVDDACYKLTYFVTNAEKVAAIIQQHTAASKAIAEMVPQVISASSETKISDKTRAKVLTHVLTKDLQMRSDAKDLIETKNQATIVKQLTKTINTKKLLTAEGLYAQKLKLTKVDASDSVVPETKSSLPHSVQCLNTLLRNKRNSFLKSIFTEQVQQTETRRKQALEAKEKEEKYVVAAKEKGEKQVSKTREKKGLVCKEVLEHAKDQKTETELLSPSKSRNRSIAEDLKRYGFHKRSLNEVDFDVRLRSLQVSRNEYLFDSSNKEEKSRDSSDSPSLVI